MDIFYNTMQDVDKTGFSQFIVTSKLISFVGIQSLRDFINITKPSVADPGLT